MSSITLGGKNQYKNKINKQKNSNRKKNVLTEFALVKVMHTVKVY